MATTSDAPLADNAGHSPYRTVIEPDQSWWQVRWAELYHYRDLLMLMVRRDFVAVYKQTILGPLWFIFQPLLQAGVMTLLMGRIAGLQTGVVPSFLFFLSGQVIWMYLSSIIAGSGNTFVANAPIFKKVYFPRLIPPLTNAISKLLTFSIQILTLTGFYVLAAVNGGLEAQAAQIAEQTGVAVEAVSPGWGLALIPLFLLHTALLALGIAMVTSSLTAKYRDVGFLIPIVLQLWMWLTVAVPPSAIPPSYEWLSLLNPMLPVVQAFRWAMFTEVELLPLGYVYSVVLTLVLFFGGLLFYQRTERTFMDTV